MKYLLDTNAVIALLKGNPAAVRERLREALSKDAALFVSTIVLHELWYGAFKSARVQENSESIRLFLSGRVEVTAFDEDDALLAGKLRAQLAQVGRPIGPYDLMIAAQAIRAGATLVTANTAEFARVPGLAWEDWS